MSFPGPNEQRQIDLARLREFFEAQPDGDVITWLRIEHESGVEMNTRGRALARDAMRKLRRPYMPVVGEGLRLSAADNSLDIMGSRFRTIDRSVRRADRTRQHLADRHLESMSEVDQQKMGALAGFFGTVRAIAKGADKLVFARLKAQAERAVSRQLEKKPAGL